MRRNIRQVMIARKDKLHDINTENKQIFFTDWSPVYRNPIVLEFEMQSEKSRWLPPPTYAATIAETARSSHYAGIQVKGSKNTLNRIDECQIAHGNGGMIYCMKIIVEIWNGSGWFRGRPEGRCVFLRVCGRLCLSARSLWCNVLAVETQSFLFWNSHIGPLSFPVKNVCGDFSCCSTPGRVVHGQWVLSWNFVERSTGKKSDVVALVVRYASRQHLLLDFSIIFVKVYI